MTALQDRADVGAMSGPTVTVTAGAVGLAIPLGTVHGGVWANDYAGFGWTCPACDAWRPFYRSEVQAYGALCDHQRKDCKARKDGGEQW